jgi:hypothetical protein
MCFYSTNGEATICPMFVGEVRPIDKAHVGQDVRAVFSSFALLLRITYHSLLVSLGERKSSVLFIAIGSTTFQTWSGCPAA